MAIFSAPLRSLAAALALSLAPWAPLHANQTEVLPDPSRVVAIGGAVTEIVYALGEEKRLVGRDSTSVFPRSVLALPDVGYMRALSPEGVLSVNPTGIVALAGSGPREAVDVLKRASVAFVEIPEAWDRAAVGDRIRRVGKAIGADAKAVALAERVDAELGRAEALTSTLGERKRVLFILSMKGGKILASGHGTAADGMIRLAGGVNAIDGYEGYKPLTDEAAVTAAPDFIVMMDRSGDHDADAASLFAHPALSATPAGRDRKLIKLDGAYLLGFGPRTAEAVSELARALYGDRLTD